jgi:hypothetical protein
VAALEIQEFPEAVYRRFGIGSRRAYAPLLAETVVPVVSIPMEDSGDEVVRAIELRTHFSALAIAAVAAQFPQAQLFNSAQNAPASNPSLNGIGRWAVIRAITLASATSMRISIRKHNLALTTLDITSHAFGLVGTVTQGGGDTSFEPRRNNVAAIVGTRMLSAQVVANEALRIVFPMPIVLLPNWGVHVAGHVVNTDLDVTFEWEVIDGVQGVT